MSEHFNQINNYQNQQHFNNNGNIYQQQQPFNEQMNFMLNNNQFNNNFNNENHLNNDSLLDISMTDINNSSLLFPSDNNNSLLLMNDDTNLLLSDNNNQTIINNIHPNHVNNNIVGSSNNVNNKTSQQQPSTPKKNGKKKKESSDEEEDENSNSDKDSEEEEKPVKKTSKSKKNVTSSSSSTTTFKKRRTPLRSTRGKLPEYLLDYEMGNIDLRKMSSTTSSPRKKSASSTSSSNGSSSSTTTPKKKKKNEKKKDDDEYMQDDEADVSSDEEDNKKKKKKASAVKRTSSSSTTKAKKQSPKPTKVKKATTTSTTNFHTNNNNNRTTSSRTSSSTSTTPYRPTNINLRALPQDNEHQRIRTPGNRFSEYQSSHLDYEAALKSLLVNTPVDNYLSGVTDASHWSISSLPLDTSCEYFDENTQTTKKLTLQQVLTSCYYLAGNIMDKTQIPTTQICFSFDTTGSQIKIIEELKFKLQKMCEQLLQDIPSLQIALIAHGDFSDSGLYYVMKKLDFSNDINQIVKFMQGLKGTGGGDSQECYEFVLKEVQTLSWVPKDNALTQKTLVIIGDENPHDSLSYFKIDWKEEVSKIFNENFIRIHSVQCQEKAHATEFYQFLADETGGKRFVLNDFDKMKDIFLGLCYREETEYQMQNLQNQVDSSSSSLNNNSTSIVRPVGSEDFTEEQLLYIHEAIHNLSISSIVLNDKQYDIVADTGACRFLRIGNVTFIEQNKDKKTRYAKMALEGKKITWITREGQWGLIIDDEIKILSRNSSTILLTDLNELYILRHDYLFQYSRIDFVFTPIIVQKDFKEIVNINVSDDCIIVTTSFNEIYCFGKHNILLNEIKKVKYKKEGELVKINNLKFERQHLYPLVLNDELFFVSSIFEINKENSEPCCWDTYLGNLFLQKAKNEQLVDIILILSTKEEDNCKKRKRNIFETI
ncbi:hypothetical protein ABK040_009229 [Willaertia magna]